jgi:hypothetical protein
MSSQRKKKPKSTARSVTGYIRARPWVARQLGEDPQLALFWKDGPLGSRLGMLWMLSSCPEPNCPCRDVCVEARSVPDSLALVELIADDALRILVSPDPKKLAGPASDMHACVRVHIDTREVTPDGKGPQDQQLLDWLKAELDEPVMAMLRAAWATAKGKKAVAMQSPR